MNSTSTQFPALPSSGKFREELGFDSRSAPWVAIAGFAFLPYMTGLLSFLYNRSIIELRPRSYLLVMAFVVLAIGRAWQLKLGFATLSFLAIHVIRVADAFVLRRVPHIESLDPLLLAATSVTIGLMALVVIRDTRTQRITTLALSLSTLLICTITNVWEWFNPGYFSIVAGRSAGFLQNPNGAAVAIIVSLSLFLCYNPRMILSGAAMLVATVGIYCTLSRGGYLALIVVCAIYLLINLRRGWQLFFALVATALVAIFLGKYATSLGTTTVTGGNVEDRIEMLAGDSSLALGESSRIDLLWDGGRRILDRPLVGHGTGASNGFVCEPHNQFVGLWVDNGIVAALLMVANYVVLAFRLWRTNKQCLVVLACLVILVPFSHNLLDDRAYLLAWAGLCVAADSPLLATLLPPGLSSRRRR